MLPPSERPRQLNEQFTTIPEHLVRRFNELSVELGFGIVGDYALRLFGELDDLGFRILVTADEQGAGFAADAYARLRGFGVAACTYGVGGLKLANAVADELDADYARREQAQRDAVNDEIGERAGEFWEHARWREGSRVAVPR